MTDTSEAEVQRLFRDAPPEKRGEMLDLLRAASRLYGRPIREQTKPPMNDQEDDDWGEPF